MNSCACDDEAISYDKVKKTIIISKIEKQVFEHLRMKNSVRKNIKNFLTKIRKLVLFNVYKNSMKEIKKYNYKSNYGYDMFGRDVEDGLNKYIGQLNKVRLKIRTIIVLGSRVKNRWTSNSDVDLTFIADNLPNKGNNIISKRIYYSQINKILSDKFFIGIEPSLYYSSKEFIAKLNDFDIHTLDAILYGKVIYDDGFWISVEREYAQIVKKYRLDPNILKEKILLV